MKISIDIIFIIVIIIIILYSCYDNKNNIENFDNVNDADISAIRNLNSLATKLTSNGGVINPGNLQSISLSRADGGDWLRINDAPNNVGRTALFGNLSINSNQAGHSGLSVGTWDDAGDNNIKAAGNITAGGKVVANNEIVGTLGGGYGQFRATSGAYGTFLRQDGNDFYILMTNANDPNGVWTDDRKGGANSIRPFRINNSNGKVYIGERDILAELDDLKNKIEDVRKNPMQCISGAAYNNRYGDIRNWSGNDQHRALTHYFSAGINEGRSASKC
jgi:hypothetical protein